jgi:hypothetical protein
MIHKFFKSLFVLFTGFDVDQTNHHLLKISNDVSSIKKSMETINQNLVALQELFMMQGGTYYQTEDGDLVELVYSNEDDPYLN